MNFEHPIVIGLAGKAGTGKTSVAHRLVPMARTFGFDESNPDPVQKPLAQYKIMWDHIILAQPLYEIVSIKQKITGMDAHDRQAYMILDVLLEVMGRNPLFGALPFNDLIKVVNLAMDWRLPEDEKPRAFMQWLDTDVCRQHRSSCFSDYASRKITNRFLESISERNDEEDDYDTPDNFGFIISDVRFEDEIDMVKSFKHGVLIKYTASEDVLNDRLLNRDGHIMSKNETQHSSEIALDSVDDTRFDAIIDTSDMDIATQAYYTQLAVQKLLEGGYV